MILFRQQLDNLLHKKAAYGASTAKKRDQVKFNSIKKIKDKDLEKLGRNCRL